MGRRDAAVKGRGRCDTAWWRKWFKGRLPPSKSFLRSAYDLFPGQNKILEFTWQSIITWIAKKIVDYHTIINRLMSSDNVYTSLDFKVIRLLHFIWKSKVFYDLLIYDFIRNWPCLIYFAFKFVKHLKIMAHLEWVWPMLNPISHTFLEKMNYWIYKFNFYFDTPKFFSDLETIKVLTYIYQKIRKFMFQSYR